MSVSVYQLKSRFQRLLQPVLRGLSVAGLSPNQLTLSTLALMGVYGGALAFGPKKKSCGLPCPWCCCCAWL